MWKIVAVAALFVAAAIYLKTTTMCEPSDKRGPSIGVVMKIAGC